MEKKQAVFDFQAEVGLTKQLGGLKSTEELVGLCHIDEGKYVLDVGCGVGATPCYLARKFGCRVVGVDISRRMVERSDERAKREGVEDRIEFRVADVQNLPFEDDLFDAVIGESVIAFPADKQRAVNECVRVTKPGGYVGFNESTWLKAPTPELVEWAAQANAEALTSDDWTGLLKYAGLREMVVETYEIDTRNEAREILRRYGCRGMMGVLCRILSLYAKSPAYRRFVKEVREGGLTPENLDEYFGYGVYVGRK